MNEVFIPVTRHCLMPLRDSNRMVAVTNVINGEITAYFNDLTIWPDISVGFSNLRGVHFKRITLLEGMNNLVISLTFCCTF